MFWRVASLNGGFISTRPTEPGSRPAACNAAGAARSRQSTLTRSAKALVRALAVASAQSCGSISTRATARPGTRAASARPAAPTPLPSSTARSPGSAAVAAASRMASCPIRCPRLGCLSRNLPPSTASSVTSAGIGTKLVPEPGLPQQSAGVIDAAFVDHYPARQDADGAFEHAHVLVEQEMGNVGGIEQSLHGRHQHGIVGTHEFAPIVFFLGPVLGHASLPSTLSRLTPPPAAAAPDRRSASSPAAPWSPYRARDPRRSRERPAA